MRGSICVEFPGFTGRRLALKQAMAAIQAYERPLFERFVAGLLAIPGLTLLRHPRLHPLRSAHPHGRVPNGRPPPGRSGRGHLAPRGVYVWSGNFYALAVTERLGLEDVGRAWSVRGWRTTTRTKKWTTA